MPASHIIINHTHFHSLLRFLHQHIAHHTAYGVILEDINSMWMCLVAFCNSRNKD